MARQPTQRAIREIQTLFSVGRVADRPDGELLAWFNVHHAAAETAFEELVSRHGGMVLDVCRRVLHNPHDVEDAFQATFLVLIRRASSIRDTSALGGWLHRVALRVALRAKSDANHRRVIEESVIDGRSGEQPHETIDRNDARSAVHEELDRLPTPYRMALIACYLEGLTHEQAATRLSLPVGTVRSRLARGRDRLRDRLVRRGLAPQPTESTPESIPARLKKTTAQSMCLYLAGHTEVGSVSASVLTLTERVIRAMNIRSIKAIAALVLAIGSIGGILPFLPTQVARQAHAAADPTKQLGGIVKDADGKPVAGATVLAGAFTSKPNHQMLTSGLDGRFTFEPKDDKERLDYVIAYKQGLAPASKFRLGGGKEPANAGVELTLRPPETFIGVVKDIDGKPVSGVNVRITYMLGRGGPYDHNPILENVIKETPLDALFTSVSDKSGVFRFPAVPSPQRVQLDATSDGMADFSTFIPGNHLGGFVSSSVTAPAILVMEPEARIRGRIVTKISGQSIAGLNVAIQSTNGSPQFWRNVTTDAEGRFEMRGLPEGGGNIFLMDQSNEGPFTYRAIDNLALHPGKTSEATLELITGVLVEGKVLEAETGKPVPSARVGMYGPARPRSGAAIMSTQPNAEGIYRFRLPPGKTYFYIAGGAPGKDGGRNVVIPENAKTFTVPTMETKPPAKKPAGISGVILNVSDRPIAGATVVGAIVSNDGKLIDRHVVTTDESGHFRLNIPKLADPNKSTRVYAFKPGLAPGKASPNEMVAPGEIKLILPRPRAFGCLVLTRDDERPVAGAEGRIERMKTPVIDGSGMTIVNIDWPVIAGTPIEAAFRVKSDAMGLLTFPSIPARSSVDLHVSFLGLKDHRTLDFSKPDMTGRWPAGYEEGFIHGESDWPSKIYLDSATANFLRK